MSDRFYQSVARRAALAALLVASLAVSTGVQAQSTVTVTRLADMSFGDVSAGSATALLYSDADASVFQLECSGMSPGQDISVALSLPTQIVNGGDTVPISFGTTDAAWSFTNDPSGATSFDPNAGVVISAKNAASFSIYVWIGGLVNPASDTPSQEYTNTLTLDAEVL